MTTGEIIIDVLILAGILATILKGILWGKEEKDVLKLYSAPKALKHIKAFKKLYQDAWEKYEEATSLYEKAETEIEDLKAEIENLKNAYNAISAGEQIQKNEAIPGSRKLDFSIAESKAANASDYIHNYGAIFEGIKKIQVISMESLLGENEGLKLIRNAMMGLQEQLKITLEPLNKFSPPDTKSDLKQED